MSRIKKRRIIIRPRPRQEPGSGGLAAALRRMILPVMFFAAAGIFGGSLWLWRVGWFEAQYQKTITALFDVTSHAGFSVEEILVEGRNQTDRDNILSVLGVKKGSPILAFDPHQALQRLTSISWVKSGTVERRLPSTLYIKLNERLPIALWQNNRRFYLIDAEGHMLREAALSENLGLPLVVGAGAQSAAADLLAQLNAQPTIFSRTRAAVRVG
ncbi:MAG: FtsQ-type POTRA domain-containing protein, partial [Proteobacteria bacterium]|nr:FtsQ-type POTRA domain-containing protein [Pseudomonadota bacterium]